MIKIKVLESDPKSSLEPIFCKIGRFPLAGMLLEDALKLRISQKLANDCPDIEIEIYDDFWPSCDLLSAIPGLGNRTEIISEGGGTLMVIRKCGIPELEAEKIIADENSLIICYPWDILEIGEELVAGIAENRIEGKIREGVVIDGKIQLGKDSILLPGVYIEGNVVIGEKCKIGPNCYIRGNTSIGNSCHIGQAVEIKNSILLDKVSAGHLSYIGDSIVCSGTNLGAGTITANFRHDGKNHRSMVDGELLDTGRRKFGAVIGEGVHTGIHTSIYPGRKIWPHASTRPGETVAKDIADSQQ